MLWKIIITFALSAVTAIRCPLTGCLFPRRILWRLSILITAAVSLAPIPFCIMMQISQKKTEWGSIRFQKSLSIWKNKGFLSKNY